jgi:WD40 repeat protein
MRSLALCLTLLFAFGTLTLLAQKYLSEGRGAATSLIAMLSVDGNCAAGIIVGSDEKSLYIATAAHVAPTLSATVHPAVIVRFFDYKNAAPVAGRFLSRFEPRGKGDLAVVVVDRNPTVNKTLDQLNLAILPLDAPQSPNLPVHSFGCSGGSWGTEGQDELLLQADDNTVDIKSDAIFGQSGGGIFNEGWELIGMAQDANGDVHKLTGRPVNSLLSDLLAWHVPVSLKVRPAQDRVKGAEEIAAERSRTTLSLQLTNEAANLRRANLSNTLLSQLLAIEAAQQNRSWVVDRAIRTGMAILPVKAASFTQGEKIEKFVASPNGQYIATVGWSNVANSRTVRVWTLQGVELPTLRRPNSESVAFSKDSSLMAVGSATAEVDVLAVPSGNAIAKIATNDDGNLVEPLVFSPDNAYIAFSSQNLVDAQLSDRGIRVWKISPAKQAMRFKPTNSMRFDDFYISETNHIFHENGVDVDEFDLADGHFVGKSTELTEVGNEHSPNFRYRAKIDFSKNAGEGPVTVVDLQHPEKSAVHGPDDVRSMVFSPDSSRVAFLTQAGTSQIWNLEKGQKECDLPVYSGQLLFSPDHRYLRAYDQSEVWDLASCKPAAWVEGKIYDFTGDSHFLAVADDSRAQLFELPSRTDSKHFMPCALGGNGLKHDVATGGDEVAAVCYRNIYRWKTDASSPGPPIHFDRWTTALAFAPDNRTIFTGTDAEEIVKAEPGLYQIPESGEPSLMAPIKANIADIEISSSGQYLAVAAFQPQFVRSQDGGLWLWRLNDGHLDLVDHNYSEEPAAQEVSFTPDERCIAEAGLFSTYVWQISGTLTQTMKESYSRSVSFSADGRYLARANRDGLFVYQRDKPEGCSFHEVQQWPFDEEVTHVSFAPSGTTIIVSTVYGDQRVMDALTGEQIAAREVPKGEAVSRFSSDGEEIVTSESDGISFWHWKTPDVLADACSRVTHNLSAADWTKFVGSEPYKKICPNVP